MITFAPTISRWERESSTGGNHRNRRGVAAAGIRFEVGRTMVDKIVTAARAATVAAPPLGTEAYDRFCTGLAHRLTSAWPRIRAENDADVGRAQEQGLPDVLVDRLRLTEEHLADLVTLTSTVMRRDARADPPPAGHPDRRLGHASPRAAAAGRGADDLRGPPDRHRRGRTAQRRGRQRGDPARWQGDHADQRRARRRRHRRFGGRRAAHGPGHRAGRPQPRADEGTAAAGPTRSTCSSPAAAPRSSTTATTRAPSRCWPAAAGSTTSTCTRAPSWTRRSRSRWTASCPPR